MKKVLQLFVLLTYSSITLFGQQEGRKYIAANSKNIAYIGRFDFTDRKNPVFMYSGCAIRTVFSGTSVDIAMKDDSLRNWFTVLLDDSLYVLKSDRKDNYYQLGKNLKNGKHTLEIIRRTEWSGGNTTFSGFYIDKGGKTTRPEIEVRKIEFIGDSYTCGYGNEGKSREEHFKYETENNYLTFGAIASRSLKAEYVTICRSGIGIYQGYGGSKGFSMPVYYDTLVTGSRALWDYRKFQPDVVAIVLGSNDMSRRFDSVQFVGAYIDFLSRIRKNYPATKILCIAGPSGEGNQWIRQQTIIKSIVERYGKKDNSVFYFAFSPFQMNGSDWHPNVAEHKQMAGELIPEIKKIASW